MKCTDKTTCNSHYFILIEETRHTIQYLYKHGNSINLLRYKLFSKLIILMEHLDNC